MAAGGGVLAGAVAFRVFLFLVPYVFMLVVVFGLGASAADEYPGTLARKSGIGGVAAKAFAGVGDLSTGERILSFLVAGFALAAGDAGAAQGACASCTRSSGTRARERSRAWPAPRACSC